MRTALFSKLINAGGLLLLIFAPLYALASNAEVAKLLLPDRIGEFRKHGKVELASAEGTTANEYEKEFTGTRAYRTSMGESFLVTVVKTRTDRGAFSLFSSESQKLLASRSKVDGVGMMSVADSSGRLLFYKGMVFVSISDESRAKNNERMITFARLVAEPIDASEGEIPVLLKHLPEWEAIQQHAVYAVSLPTLQEAAGNRPVLDAVSFSGGTDAVTALYDISRLVIVEHTTPQLATNADARINARINELKQNGQPVPTVYRRVGNYAVFVFDAPDETTALQLIDKIAYEQIVQWLGTDPRWLARAEKEYRRTTAGVILAVFKASGLSLLICLGIGGIFGSIVFRRRRAQQATAQAYSDAGGMLRLNIDDMTPKVDSSRLLGKGDA